MEIKETGLKNRMNFIRAIVVICMVALIVRVFYIKTVHGEEYEQKAIIQHVTKFDNTLNPNRGSILDRNKKELAYSRTVYNVIFDPRVFFETKDVLIKDKPSKKESTLQNLASMLDIDYDMLKGYVAPSPDNEKVPTKNSNYVVLKKQISKQEKDELEKLGLVATFFEMDTKRSYPHESLLCHVIGFIRDEAWGLERQYNNEMSGIPGRYYIVYDEANNPVVVLEKPTAGNSITTTIDDRIQQYAEEAAKKAMVDYQARNSGVIVMNPQTGEILAMASEPSFNVNEPDKSQIYNLDEWNTLTDEDKTEELYETWKNFNVSSTFEPGSIYKPLLLAAAFEENLIPENTTFYCNGYSMVSGIRIRCHKAAGHGTQTPHEVLQNSCNVGMIEIGLKAGKSLFYKYQTDFGFGQKTYIDLPGEESCEYLLYPEDKLKPIDIATGSMGQSFNCTPIQMITAFSSLLNGGNLMKPYIVSQIVNENNEIVKEIKPEVVRKVLSKETADMLRHDLQLVIDQGTGVRAQIEGYNMGGKTGTAQQGAEREEKTLSFIGFLTVDNPSVVALVVIDKPLVDAQGSNSAAPIFKELMEKIIPYYAIEPSYQTEGLTLDSSVPSFEIEDYENTSLIETGNALLNKGIRIKISGDGTIITGQTIKSGTKVPQGTEIILYVKMGDDNITASVLPDVTGLNISDAYEMLQNQGYTVYFEGNDAGIVKKQVPKGNSIVDSTTSIVLTVE